MYQPGIHVHYRSVPFQSSDFISSSYLLRFKGNSQILDQVPLGTAITKTLSVYVLALVGAIGTLLILIESCTTVGRFAGGFSLLFTLAAVVVEFVFIATSKVGFFNSIGPGNLFTIYAIIILTGVTFGCCLGSCHGQPKVEEQEEQQKLEYAQQQFMASNEAREAAAVAVQQQQEKVQMLEKQKERSCC